MPPRSFQRAGLYVEELVRWFDHVYDIQVGRGGGMECCTAWRMERVRVDDKQLAWLAGSAAPAQHVLIVGWVRLA